jgi:rhamnosyltransferase
MNIVAVIITYNPNLMQLRKTIDSLIKQLDHIIIIDNGNTLFYSMLQDDCTFVNLEKNYGIAYAQNRGIEKAQELGAKFIVLSDQDTIYPEGYIKSNLLVYKSLQDHDIAALVPVFYDVGKKLKSPIMITKFSFTYDYSKIYAKTAQAISSGSFLITNPLNDIGLMNEKLFIDYVDFEWCWRATKMGYRIVTIPNLIIEHHLGDKVIRIGKKRIFIENDMRYYYIIRNGIYLAVYSNYLLFYERILLLKKVLIQIMVVILFCFSFNVIKTIVNAIFEGLSGRMKIYS